MGKVTSAVSYMVRAFAQTRDQPPGDGSYEARALADRAADPRYRTACEAMFCGVQW